MNFSETRLPGVFEVDSDVHWDERGSFQRIYCGSEWRDNGLEPVEAQCAISRNRVKGTLRGLHFVSEQEGEAKLVRCIKGRIFDAAVDLRSNSPTRMQHFAVELSADRGNCLYLPRGVAHGFLTLEDDCDVLYQFSRQHRPGVEQGVRWDDPSIGIDWPIRPLVMSDKDGALPTVAEMVRRR